jgi:hypothetical protein
MQVDISAQISVHTYILPLCKVSLKYRSYILLIILRFCRFCLVTLNIDRYSAFVRYRDMKLEYVETVNYLFIYFKLAYDSRTGTLWTVFSFEFICP